MSMWNFCLFKTIFGKSMFTGGRLGGKNTSTLPLITSTHLLLSSVEKAVSRKLFKYLAPPRSRSPSGSTGRHSPRGSPDKDGLTAWMCLRGGLKEYLVGDELAGPEVSLVQKRSCSSQRVELGRRRDLLEKRAKGRVRHCARSIPRVTDLFDLNVWDIEKLTQRWGQQQMEFWGQPSQNHLSLHSSQKDCYHSAFSPGDKSTTSHLVRLWIALSSYQTRLCYNCARLLFFCRAHFLRQLCRLLLLPNLLGSVQLRIFFLSQPELCSRYHCSSETEYPCPFPYSCCSPVCSNLFTGDLCIKEPAQKIRTKNQEKPGSKKSGKTQKIRKNHLPALETYCGCWSGPRKEL